MVEAVVEGAYDDDQYVSDLNRILILIPYYRNYQKMLEVVVEEAYEYDQYVGDLNLILILILIPYCCHYQNYQKAVVVVDDVCDDVGHHDDDVCDSGPVHLTTQQKEQV